MCSRGSSLKAGANRLLDCNRRRAEQAVGEQSARQMANVQFQQRIVVWRGGERKAAALTVLDTLESTYPESDSLKAEAMKYVKK